MSIGKANTAGIIVAAGRNIGPYGPWTRVDHVNPEGAIVDARIIAAPSSTAEEK